MATAYASQSGGFDANGMLRVPGQGPFARFGQASPPPIWSAPTLAGLTPVSAADLALHGARPSPFAAPSPSSAPGAPVAPSLDQLRRMFAGGVSVGTMYPSL